MSVQRFFSCNKCNKTFEVAQDDHGCPSCNPSPDTLREALSDYAHDAWSRWMNYLFSKCTDLALTVDGGKGSNHVLVIPPSLVKRWKRQLRTHYQDLPENEKESDRQEADKMLAIIDSHTPKL